MPGAEERVLRRRIGSVQNTKKITRAMELISATRVAKAQLRAQEARPYAEEITSVIEDLATAGAEVSHPLLEERPAVSRVGLVVITSDRGLAGAYNSSVLRATEREVDAIRNEGADYAIYAIGRKAQGYLRFRGYRLEQVWTGISDTPAYHDAREVARTVTRAFEEGHLDRVQLIYTEFVSLGTQRVVIRRFLPLQRLDVVAEQGGGTGARASFEFEPSPAAVLSSLLPRYVESRMYSALLDGSASEHASRQRAMKAATDNAEELIIKLARRMNQARQDAITTEIMEIIGGAEALSADKADPEELILDRLDPERAFPAHLGGSHLFAQAPES